MALTTVLRTNVLQCENEETVKIMYTLSINDRKKGYKTT